MVDLSKRVYPVKPCRECGDPFKSRSAGHQICDGCKPGVTEARTRAQVASRRKAERVFRNYWNTWWQRSKLTVIARYGGKCACCGEGNPYFLTLDHINNDGARHRKEIGTATALYRWVIRNNFPDTFRILCWNCNSGRATNGNVCPHEGSEFSLIPVGTEMPESWVW